MDELVHALFGSSDSDSGSDTMDTENQEQPNKPLPPHPSSDTLDLATDPIFRSIMEGDDDLDGHGLPLEQPAGMPQTIHPRHEPHPAAHGLCIHTHVLSDTDQARLMAQITEKNFFKAGQQNQAMCFGERDLGWLGWLVERMVGTGVLQEPYWTCREPQFDQGILNLYYPGSGIKPHVDLARFEDGIVVISLLSSINMDFYPAMSPMTPNDPPEGPTRDLCSAGDNREPTFTLRLEPGSILTMQGSARYEWEHGIKEVMDDMVNGEWVQRKIRVSITLRKMRKSAWQVGPKE